MISQELRQQIKELSDRYPHAQSALLPALHLLQKSAGSHSVPKDQLEELAELLRIPVATAFSVQTYYTMYNLKPVGKYHLQVDTNVPAMLAGAEEVMARLVKILGIKVGETTPDGLFTLSSVEDLASCGTCPVIQVNDRYYENMTVAKTSRLISLLRQGIMPDWPADADFSTVCDILLHRRHRKDPSLAGYVADGGYQALPKALKLKPEDVTTEVKNSGIRGRGGAGFPMGLKWSFLPKNSTKPIYLVCNADEGEPGTFKDRQIMEFDPHLLIEGMVISCYALGAKQAYIYIRGEFAWIAAILENAIEEARKAGYLGENILGSGASVDILVHLGAGAYVCGEETALIESIEGKRGNPRIKPPFPAIEGLYGCPTVVNNVETLANVPYILQHGAEAYKKIGTPNNFGPKIFGISGHVNLPGAYEYPLGVPLDELIKTAGGVIGKLKAVIVGGLSVPILTAAEAEGLKMDYDSCVQRGTMLGSGGIIVMNETASIPKIALRAIKFYAHESCGQCTPCRQGSNTMVVMLERVVAGKGSKHDIEVILDLCETIKGATLCPTGDAFSVPIEAMIKKFRSEFDALVS